MGIFEGNVSKGSLAGAIVGEMAGPVLSAFMCGPSDQDCHTVSVCRPSESSRRERYGYRARLQIIRFDVQLPPVAAKPAKLVPLKVSFRVNPLV